jgi:hypothetical protein
LGVYPFFLGLRLAVSPLRRVTFSKRRKGNRKGFAPAFGPLAGARGSFAPGSIRGAAPTVCFAAPPLAVFGCAKRSLRSHPRINPSTQPSDVARGSRSKALSSLRSSCVGAAAGCDPLILLVLFVGVELAREGGLTADPFLSDRTQFLWEPGLPAMAA